MASDEYWRRVILKAAKKDKRREWRVGPVIAYRDKGLSKSPLIE